MLDIVIILLNTNKIDHEYSFDLRLRDIWLSILLYMKTIPHPVASVTFFSSEFADLANLFIWRHSNFCLANTGNDSRSKRHRFREVLLYILLDILQKCICRTDSMIFLELTNHRPHYYWPGMLLLRSKLDMCMKLSKWCIL